MLTPIKLLDVELTRPLIDLAGLNGYETLQALVRAHGIPLGYIHLPIVNGFCSAAALSKAILDHLGGDIIRHLVEIALKGGSLTNWNVVSPTNRLPPTLLPLVTVAVCTRDRTPDLAICLEAIHQLDYPNLDIIVIDNAPISDATKSLLRIHYPYIRYVCEPRPGLDWSRNRAILEAKGEIIAFTDDDVVVDRRWASGLAQTFAENPEVMAVTGLVVPYELETEAQLLFEKYGGFGRGFERRWYRVERSKTSRRWWYHGAGQFGTGANMAYRRTLFEAIGCFDPALDVGTLTNGGGDLEMFFRVLKEGHLLVYEPKALVRHRHRREYDRLRTQLINNGVGFYAYLMRSALEYPDERFNFFRLGVWWLWWWNIRRWLISFIHPERFPRDLILAELWGSLVGLGRYHKARSVAAQILERL